MTFLTRCSVGWLVVVFACASEPARDPDPETPVDGGMEVTLDKAACAVFAQSLVAAAQACGSPLPAGAQATVDGWCRKGIDAAAMCGGTPAAGLDCFASPDPNDWVCSLGEPYPACGGDLSAALGAYCLLALGNPECASIKCQYNADCSDGMACNSATGRCYGKQAYCIGLPCRYDADCPDGERCNGAEHACVGE
jgi:hypothetical protein